MGGVEVVVDRRKSMLETLAAELTTGADRVALQTESGTPGSIWSWISGAHCARKSKCGRAAVRMPTRAPSRWNLQNDRSKATQRSVTERNWPVRLFFAQHMALADREDLHGLV